MPDRYADAVRARRAELRTLRDRLAGGHRAELRGVLGLSRVRAAAEITAALAGLSAEVAGQLARADRAARRRFPARLDRAVADVAAGLHVCWAGRLRPALRRVAAARRLPVPAGWPPLPVARPLPAMPARPRPGRWRAAAAGAAQGAAWWRMSLVVLPVWGLPALGGRALAPLAAGTAVAAVALAARARVVAGERARLRVHAEDVLAAARVALAADLGRKLIELEGTAGATLDAAVRRRRAEVDAELARLTPPGGRHG